MDKRTTGVVLVLVAIPLLLASVLMKVWWHTENDGFRITVGLLQAEACPPEGSCKAISTTEFGTSKIWVTSGRMAFGAALLTSLLLFVAGMLSLAGKTTLNGPVSPSRLALVLSGCTIFLGVIYFFSAELPDEFAGWFGLPLLLGGGVFGVVGAMLCESPRAAGLPVQPSIPAPRPAQATLPLTPACPQCSGPTEWRQEYQRHFCPRCAVYL